MKPKEWTELLEVRGVDHRIIGLIATLAEVRSLEPPTTETKQLLIALEPDGYAAGRVAGSVLSLFFNPDRATSVAERHGFSIGQRSAATWIVRIPAEELESRLGLVRELLVEALARVEPLGSWQRGLPDAMTKAQGDICAIHFVQRSITGECEMCQ